MDTYALAVQQLKKAIENAIEKAITNGELPQAETAPFIIETPADRSHGDFATNAAMAGAKAFRMPPFKIHRLSHQTLTLRVQCLTALKQQVRDSSTSSSALNFIRL